MDFKNRKKLLLENPQDGSAETVHQKRKWEEKSLENTNRGKSKVDIEKMRWNARKMVIEPPCLQTH